MSIFSLLFSRDPNPRKIAKKLVSGRFKSEQEGMQLFSTLVERAIASSQQTYANVSEIHGKGPIYYIKEGGWSVSNSGNGLQISYQLIYGKTLRVAVTPRFSDRLESVEFSPVNPKAKLERIIKEVYIIYVANVLSSYFGKDVRVAY